MTIIGCLSLVSGSMCAILCRTALERCHWSYLGESSSMNLPRLSCLLGCINILEHQLLQQPLLEQRCPGHVHAVQRLDGSSSPPAVCGCSGGKGACFEPVVSKYGCADCAWWIGSPEMCRWVTVHVRAQEMVKRKTLPLVYDPSRPMRFGVLPKRPTSGKEVRWVPLQGRARERVWCKDSCM